MNAKRILLALLTCAVVATMAGAHYSKDTFEANAKKRTLTGTWLLTITPDGSDAPPPFEGLYTFTSDGIALFSSVGPPIPGLGNPGHGVWERINNNTFAVTWKQFTFDDIYTTNGSLVLNSIITLDSDDEFTSRDTVKLYDTGGVEIVTLGGTETGRRMKISN